MTKNNEELNKEVTNIVNRNNRLKYIGLEVYGSDYNKYEEYTLFDDYANDASNALHLLDNYKSEIKVELNGEFICILIDKENEFLGYGKAYTLPKAICLAFYEANTGRQFL